MPTFPQPFGRYELLERIGRGGMAEIYRARLSGPRGFEKIVAIKRLLPVWSQNAEFVAMLVDEAKVLTHLVHPNIVNVYELGVEAGEAYIAMEYVPGLNLKQYFHSLKKQRESMPLSIALYAVAQVLKGLDYAHTRRTADGAPLSLVHRDVSPQNVLVSPEGEVKLTDFGIAKAVIRSSEHTETGILKGKFAYMSPEQVRGAPTDGKSDLFAVGLILFECVSGTRYFNGENDLGVIEAVRSHAESSLAERLGLLPAPLLPVLVRALHPDPRERYGSARHFLEDVEALLNEARRVRRGAGEWVEPQVYFRKIFAAFADLQNPNTEGFTHSQRVSGKTKRLPLALPPVFSLPTLLPRAHPVATRRFFQAGHRAIGLSVVFLFLMSAAAWGIWRGGHPDKKTTAAKRHLDTIDRETFSDLQKAVEPEVKAVAIIAPETRESSASLDVKIEGQNEPSSPLPLAPVLFPARGSLRVSASPWALVKVEGVARGLETPTVQHLPIGQYPIVLSYNGETLRTVAEVRASRETRCRANFSPGKKGVSCQ